MKNARLVDPIYRDPKAKRTEDEVVALLADTGNTVVVDEATRHDIERVKRRVRKEHGLPVWYQGAKIRGVKVTVMWSSQPEVSPVMDTSVIGPESEVTKISGKPKAAAG